MGGGSGGGLPRVSEANDVMGAQHTVTGVQRITHVDSQPLPKGESLMGAGGPHVASSKLVQSAEGAVGAEDASIAEQWAFERVSNAPVQVEGGSERASGVGVPRGDYRQPFPSTEALITAQRAFSELPLSPEGSPSIRRGGGEEEASPPPPPQPHEMLRRTQSAAAAQLGDTTTGSSPRPRPLIDWQLLHQTSPSRVDVARVAAPPVAPPPSLGGLDIGVGGGGFDTLLQRARISTVRDFGTGVDAQYATVQSF
eukprot:Hpha_TRINITY_DN8615_c0_g1::TRINITY_DN8615_c0_g1_i1::g.168912::m.168912